MTNGGLTLGEFLQRLKIERSRINKDMWKHDEVQVFYDIGDLFPTEFASFRGYYEDIALGFSAGEIAYEPQTVDEFIERTEATIGATFYGYKGGDFKMDEDSALWIANWGDSSSTVVYDVRLHSFQIVIHTRYED